MRPTPLLLLLLTTQSGIALATSPTQRIKESPSLTALQAMQTSPGNAAARFDGNTTLNDGNTLAQGGGTGGANPGGAKPTANKPAVPPVTTASPAGAGKKKDGKETKYFDEETIGMAGLGMAAGAFMGFAFAGPWGPIVGALIGGVALVMLWKNVGYSKE